MDCNSLQYRAYYHHITTSLALTSANVLESQKTLFSSYASLNSKICMDKQNRQSTVLSAHVSNAKMLIKLFYSCLCTFLPNL